MEQILVTIDDSQSLASVRNAITKLRGVVSTSVLKNTSLSKTEKQQAYVKDTLTRAMKEVKLSKLEGKEFQDIDDFIKEMREGQVYGSINSVGPEFKREFKRLYKKYRSLLDDFETWKNEILNNPLLGDDLGGGVRKVRMAIASKGKGKSGGARILTLNLMIDPESMKITLLTIYDKSEIANVKDDYIK